MRLRDACPLKRKSIVLTFALLTSTSDSLLVMLYEVSHSSTICIDWSVCIKLLGLYFFIELYLLVNTDDIIVNLVLKLSQFPFFIRA
jgi:hypothetical protein